MSLVKCKNCKKDISTTVKFCPHCGEFNERMYCVECGKEVNSCDSACSNCGYVLKQNEVSSSVVNGNVNGNCYEISFAGLICSFFVPIVGLVLGIISLKANSGLKNQAKTFGLIATIVSGFSVAITAVLLLCYCIVLVVGLTLS